MSPHPSPPGAPQTERRQPRGTAESGQPLASGLRRWLYVGLAGIFVGLGLLGVALPGLPTTPFLLVASYLLLRSSPTLHRRLLNSKTFGPTLRDWDKHRGLRRRTKRVAIIACGIMVAISVATGALPWPGRLLVAAAGAYGIWFVSRLPVVPDQARDRPPRP